MRMLNTYHDGRGFTLIELLIVVAIIGILAAIAFPMLSVFRMRAYNSSACSDIRNVKTAEESLNAVFQTYGISEGSALAPVLVAAATGGSGPGAASAGPAPAA